MQGISISSCPKSRRAACCRRAFQVTFSIPASLRKAYDRISWIVSSKWIRYLPNSIFLFQGSASLSLCNHTLSRCDTSQTILPSSRPSTQGHGQPGPSKFAGSKLRLHMHFPSFLCLSKARHSSHSLPPIHRRILQKHTLVFSYLLRCLPFPVATTHLVLNICGYFAEWAFHWEGQPLLVRIPPVPPPVHSLRDMAWFW